MLDLDLSGRHALVCGASQGIGRATAFALAEHGADVTVLARSRELLEALAATLPKRDGQRHGFLVADLRDRAALRTSVAALAATSRIASSAPLMPVRPSSKRTMISMYCDVWPE